MGTGVGRVDEVEAIASCEAVVELEIDLALLLSTVRALKLLESPCILTKFPYDGRGRD